MILMNKSYNVKGNGTKIVLESNNGHTIEVPMIFPTSTNRIEYKVCLFGLQMALKMGANVLLDFDSQLVTLRIKSDCEMRELIIHQYLEIIRSVMIKFTGVEVQYIPKDLKAKAKPNSLNELFKQRI